MARKYNPELQASALHKATVLGLPLKQVAVEAGVSLSTLRRWIKTQSASSDAGSPAVVDPKTISMIVVLLDQDDITPKLERILSNEGFQSVVSSLSQHALGAGIADTAPWLAQARVVEISQAGVSRLANLIERGGKDVPMLFIATTVECDFPQISPAIDYVLVLTRHLDRLSDQLDRLYAQREQRLQLRSYQQQFEMLQRCCYQAFDALSSPVAILSSNGHLYANPVYLQLFGYADIAALQAISLTSLLTGNDTDSVASLLTDITSEFSAAALDLTVQSHTMHAEFTPFPGVVQGVQLILKPVTIRTAPRPVAVPEPAVVKCGDDEQILWAGRVAKALKDDSLFSILYQPIVNLNGGTAACYEALLRMYNEGGGEYLPGKFMPSAQQAGLMGYIDKWVIRHTCKLIKSEATQDRVVTIFVNISRDSLMSETFCTALGQLISSYNIAPQSLVFEVQESDLLYYGEQCQPVLTGMRALGCAIALDHFSGSEAAFALLGNLEVDYIKLDGALVRGLKDGHVGRDRIIRFTRDFTARGIQSIAGCVQHAESVAQLWQCGVNYVQGYFLQHPSKALEYDFLNGDYEVTVGEKL